MYFYCLGKLFTLFLKNFSLFREKKNCSPNLMSHYDIKSTFIPSFLSQKTQKNILHEIKLYGILTTYKTSLA